MSKKVIIIGSGDDGLMAQRLAELQAANPGVEVVTIEEARQRGLSETFEFKARPQPVLEAVVLKDIYSHGGMSNRARRRKQERDAKNFKSKKRK